jgi:peptidyl-dipeptidase A
MRRITGVVLAALVLAASSALPAAAQSARLTLGGPAPVVRTERELRAFLDELEAQEMALAESNMIENYYLWKGETRHFAAPFGRLLADLASRRDYAAVIDRWNGRVKDSTLARRLFLHHRDFLVARVNPALTLELVDLQTAIQDTVGQFRFDVGGRKLTRTERGAIMDTTADRSLREAAFRAATQIAPHVRAPIVRAMGLIDRTGRLQGFPNGAAAGLNNSTLDPGQVLSDLDAFEKATHSTYAAMLASVQRDLKVDRVEPWDLDYWLHLKETAGGTDAWPKEPGLARLRDLANAIGFRYDSMPIDVKVWDVPTGGITFPVRPPYEARLLTNPFAGSQFYETLFHEYGHALNFTLMRKDLPAAFYRGDETPLAEGLAETIGHFAYDQAWLERAAGVPAARARELESVGKLALLLWIRRTIATSAYVEVSHYLHPAADLDSLFAASYQRFVGVTLPKGDYVSGRDMYATGPLYFQSYLYANMIAAQLREAMRKEFGVEDLTNEPRVAGWLTKHFFVEGAGVPWQEKVRRATGRPLSAEALGRYLGAGAER